MEDKIIVTIDREYGSGGHEVGKYLAQRLGIAFYDDEFIAKAAAKTGFDEEYVRRNEENIPTASIASYFGGIDIFNTSPFDQIQMEEARIIKEIAEQGSCVIIGRAADYILKDLPHVSIFVYAPLEARIKRIKARPSLYRPHGDDDIPLEKSIRTIDKQRKRYYEFYTDNKWGSHGSYDLLVNTARTGIDGAAMIIETYIKECRGKDILSDF